MKRRDFIKAGSLITIPVFINGFGTRLFASVIPVIPREYNNKVLVLIQLDGGNDTLNTVIPIEHYSSLSGLRGNILIPDNKVLKINDKTGLHPSLNSIKSLYDNGYVNIIRAAGYPNQNRSHFRSTDIWMSGSGAEKYETTGWLGRYFTLDHPDFPEDYPNDLIEYPFAVSLGSTASETCQGVKANYSIAVSDPKAVGELFEGEWDYTPPNCYGSQLNYVRDMVRQSNLYSGIVSSAYDKGNNLSTKYQSTNKLASDLKIVARLISGGLKTKVYVLRLGGFDTHSGQVDASDTTKGAHANLLQTLSEAIGAFHDDIKLLGIENQVLGMTFSEFGRQIRSNGSNGTDHGTAVDMFLFGSCVNPGITGNNPEIKANEEKGMGVTMQNDFRSVYSTILSYWFGLGQADTGNVLFGSFPGLNILSDCTTSSADHAISDNPEFFIGPNPARNEINIIFSNTGICSGVNIFDETGQKVISIQENLINGSNSLFIPVSDLPTGIYFAKAVIGDRMITKKFIKM